MNAPKTAGGTLSAHVLQRLLDHVAEAGHDLDAVCRSVGLHPEVLRAPKARVPYALVEALSVRVATLTGDDNLGLHLAQRVPEMVGHDAGLLMLMSSASIRAGLDRLVRLQRYWGDGERGALVAVTGGLAFRFTNVCEHPLALRHGDECALAETLIGMRALSGRAVIPLAVRFKHPAPSDLREHLALFGRAPAFCEESTQIELADADLDAPLPHANAAYCAIFEQQVVKALGGLPIKHAMVEEVRVATRAMLAAGACTLPGTARVLGVSARTLQRRLQDAGTSFADLLDALRQELAVAYLDQGLSVAEIAFLLGYNAPSALHHAFKRWTGKAPEQLRRDRRADAHPGA